MLGPGAELSEEGGWVLAGANTAELNSINSVG